MTTFREKEERWKIREGSLFCHFVTFFTLFKNLFYYVYVLLIFFANKTDTKLCLFPCFYKRLKLKILKILL